MKNLFIWDEDYEEPAKTRAEFCKLCEELNKYKVCKKCWCFMPAKIKISFIKCPLGKW